MEMTGGPIVIVGCGPGARACLTLEAEEAIVRAEVLIGAPRLLALVPEAAGERIEARGGVAEVSAAIAARPGRRVAVLVSGDPGVASLARLVLQQFGRDACRVIPGLSSIQVAFARLGMDWTGARILIAHGSLPRATSSELEDEDAIAVLMGAPGAAQWVAALAGHLGSRLFLAESLTLPGETVRELSPDTLRGEADTGLRIAILLRRDR